VLEEEIIDSFYFFVFLVEICSIFCGVFSLVEFIMLFQDSSAPSLDFFLNNHVEVRKWISLAVAIYAVIVTVVVGILAGLHVFLVSTGQNTYENIKDKYKEMKNPFRQSLTKNWMKSLCGPQWPSYIQTEKYSFSV